MYRQVEEVAQDITGAPGFILMGYARRIMTFYEWPHLGLWRDPAALAMVRRC